MSKYTILFRSLKEIINRNNIGFFDIEFFKIIFSILNNLYLYKLFIEFYNK